MFDFDSLTLGEVSYIEDLSGMSIGAIADEDMPKGKALAAVYTVYKRRTGTPDYKFNEALNVPISEAAALFADEETDEAGEDDASEKPAPKKKRS